MRGYAHIFSLSIYVYIHIYTYISYPQTYTGYTLGSRVCTYTDAHTEAHTHPDTPVNAGNLNRESV